MIEGEVTEWLDLGTETIGSCTLTMKGQVLHRYDTEDGSCDSVPLVRYWITDPTGKYLTGCPAAPYNHIQTLYRETVINVATNWLIMYYPEMLEKRLPETKKLT